MTVTNFELFLSRFENLLRIQRISNLMQCLDLPILYPIVATNLDFQVSEYSFQNLLVASDLIFKISIDNLGLDQIKDSIITRLGYLSNKFITRSSGYLRKLLYRQLLIIENFTKTNNLVSFLFLYNFLN